MGNSSSEERFKDADNMICDDYRIIFMTEHLFWLYKAIEEGANCLGYHVWTPIDCWSWRNSYKNRYGLIALNTHTQIKTLKKSAYWYKQLTDTSTLDISEEILEKYRT